MILLLFNIGNFGSIPSSSLIEMSIGTFIGAITFSGSILAFGKLQGTISGKPIVFKFQHLINALIFLFIIFLYFYFVFNQSPTIFWTIVRSFNFTRFFSCYSNWWCRYASCNFNA